MFIKVLNKKEKKENTRNVIREEKMIMIPVYYDNCFSIILFLNIVKYINLIDIFYFI